MGLPNQSISLMRPAGGSFGGSFLSGLGNALGAGLGGPFF